jgi:hypothetical protein
MNKKHNITIPVNIDILVSDEVDSEEFYKAILEFFEKETERLKTANGFERWPTGTINGASGVGAVYLVKNSLSK